MNNNLRHNFRKVGVTTVLLTVAVLGQNIARADISGKHPFYLHARSDLRRAEKLIHTRDEPNVVAELQIAGQQVHRAIAKIDEAAVLDRKDVDDNPQIDASLRHLDKFREIYKLLRRAEQDISREEDNLSAVGWRDSAKGNINQAKQRIEAAAARDVVDDLRSSHY